MKPLNLARPILVSSVHFFLIFITETITSYCNHLYFCLNGKFLETDFCFSRLGREPDKVGWGRTSREVGEKPGKPERTEWVKKEWWNGLSAVCRFCAWEMDVSLQATYCRQSRHFCLNEWMQRVVEGLECYFFCTSRSSFTCMVGSGRQLQPVGEGVGDYKVENSVDNYNSVDNLWR